MNFRCRNLIHDFPLDGMIWLGWAFFFSAGPYHPPTRFLVTSIWGSADFADVSSTPKGQESRRSVCCYPGLKSTRLPEPGWNKPKEWCNLGILLNCVNKRLVSFSRCCGSNSRGSKNRYTVLWLSISWCSHKTSVWGPANNRCPQGGTLQLKLLLQLDTRRTITVSETLAIVTDPEGWRFTLPKTNIALENRPSQKKIILPATIFSLLCEFLGVYIWMSLLCWNEGSLLYPAST